ncbi:hypothetical protein A5699_23740 [Mycobacterium sp. E802]|nr:hypothetical protein A5699_23740 [Mycobacterium sp. E802]
MDHLALPTFQILRAEGVGQQLGQWPRATGMVDEHPRPAVFQQHLTAPSAGHEQGAIRAHTRQRDEPSTPLRMQGADHSALGTET